MPAPVTDFALANRTLSDVLARPVVIHDSPHSGNVGVLDAQDTYAGAAPAASPRRLTLGKLLAHDVAFRMRVVDAARALAASGAAFSRDSMSDRVNPEEWTLGFGGRMQVRKFRPDGSLGSPAQALRDIFANGHLYAFECATAIMVIFHKAILDTLGNAAFDELFAKPRYLTFFRWSIKDNDFADVERIDRRSKRLIAGSHYFYENRDIDPAHAAFAGENVIYLGDDNGQRMFFAHGIFGSGARFVVSEEELIAALRSLRRPGATAEPERTLFTYSIDAAKLARKRVANG